jgi:glycine cleavage system H protein
LSKGDGIYPEDLRYTKEHEWLGVSGDVATVGITHYAQSELGDIVTSVPQIGSAVAGSRSGPSNGQGRVGATAPASGTVAEVNGALTDHPRRERDP